MRTEYAIYVWANGKPIRVLSAPTHEDAKEQKREIEAEADALQVDWTIEIHLA